MEEIGKASDPEATAVEAIHSQLEHFRHTEPPCRGMQLPDGILLRHAQSRSLYFYLRTGVADGKIRTQVYASDSPYERQKASIGVVTTPMFDRGADFMHLEKLEKLIREWVEFTKEGPAGGQDFRSFDVGNERT